MGCRGASTKIGAGGGLMDALRQSLAKMDGKKADERWAAASKRKQRRPASASVAESQRNFCAGMSNAYGGCSAPDL